MYGSESGTGSTLGNKKSSAEAALDELRTEMRMNGYSLAVGYLGHYRSGYKDLESYLFSSGILDEFPFLENFPQSRFVDCAGDELYLIVPLEEDANLFVNNWYIDESNDYLGGTNPVSYTHLDVYKRQVFTWASPDAFGPKEIILSI